MPTPRNFFCPIALTAALVLGACSHEEVSIVNGPVYPAIPQTSVENVQVVRHGTTVTMTNTSSKTFENARLWANQWYSHEIALWSPGQTITLEVANFKDKFGTPMKAGGFWAAENPEKLVLMQVEQGTTLTGLIVIGQAD